jgi:hypothetical protein
MLVRKASRRNAGVHARKSGGFVSEAMIVGSIYGVGQRTSICVELSRRLPVQGLWWMTVRKGRACNRLIIILILMLMMIVHHDSIWTVHEWVDQTAGVFSTVEWVRIEVERTRMTHGQCGASRVERRRSIVVTRRI